MFFVLTVALSSACTHSTETEADYSRTPTLFVHGHGLAPAYWNVLIETLVQQGYPRSFLRTVDIEPNTLGNRQAAEQFIAPAVQTLLADSRRAAQQAGHAEPRSNRVDIVAHSMGAVSSRWYVARIGPDTVRTWIAIGGSNYGTDYLCSHTDAGAQEMCPAFANSEQQSEIQFELNGPPGGSVDPTPYGIGRDEEGVSAVPGDAERNVLYLTIRVEPDDWIEPAHSAAIAGAGGVRVNVPLMLGVKETSSGNYLVTKPDAHDFLPGNRTVIRLVTAMLRARDPARQVSL